VLAGPLDPLSQRLRSNVLSVENEDVPSRNYTTLQAWLGREVSSVAFWTVPFATDAMRTAFDNHDGHRDGQEAREAGKYVVWLARLVHYIGSQHLCMGFKAMQRINSSLDMSSQGYPQTPSSTNTTVSSVM